MTNVTAYPISIRAKLFLFLLSIWLQYCTRFSLRIQQCTNRGQFRILAPLRPANYGMNSNKASLSHRWLDTRYSRKRKTKCDGVRPTCRTCLKRKSTCKWTNSLIAGNFVALLAHETDSSKTCSESNTTGSIQLQRPSTKTTNNGALPTTLLLQKLFRIFLERHHDVELCSFLHKPSQDIATLGSKSPLLVNAIITLSALYVSDEEAINEFGFGSASAFSNHYCEIARALARSLSDDPSSSYLTSV